MTTIGLAPIISGFYAPRSAAPRPDADDVRDDIIHREFTVKGYRPETREADFVFSTDTIDSYGERVEQVWRLDRFEKNPVALFGHNNRDLPIGYAKNVGVIDGRLIGTIVFATAEANPLAEQVVRSIEQKTLRAVSVGFIPHSVRQEMENDRAVYVLSDNELVEISVVPVPANPDALLRMRQRAAGAAKDRTMAIANETENKDLAALRAEHEKTKAEHATALTRIEALETQNKALAAERDAAVSRATKAEDVLVDREVDALVGVKITKAERDTYAKLAKSNRVLFDELIAQRAPMTLLRQDPAAMGSEAAVVEATKTNMTDTNGSAFANLVSQRAG